MGWKRTNGCLMCGRDRCLEKKDEPGVGYCFRFQTMHRNGKAFIKEGQEQDWTVFREGERGSGVWGGGEGGRVFSEKGGPPSPPPQVDGQIEFDFGQV